MLNIDEIKDKRIAVLLSGGVDSSVVVWEFARLGGRQRRDELRFRV